MTIPTTLAVERAVRRAAVEGNRLLAAATARIDVTDEAALAQLRATLERMGARLLQANTSVNPDFAFVDDAAAIACAEAAADSAAMQPVLPTLTVALDGAVGATRGASPAERIGWAAGGMPATAVLAKQLADEMLRSGEARRPRVAVSLVLEPKTVAFTLTLEAAGLEVALFSAVSETDPEIAAELTRTGRVAVFAPTVPVAEGEKAIDAANAAAILDWAPDFLIDDGSHLIRLAHSERPAALQHLVGAAEETTSGVRPLLEMQQHGELMIPVIAVNDARTKTGFDNLVGTGQSCVLAIADELDALGWCRPGQAAVGYQGIADTAWAVIGFGPVGVGTARFAAALGARVTVVERDAVRALDALHAGYEVAPKADAIATADVVVSATGVWHTIEVGDIEAMRPGTAVAVAGGIDDEIALEELAAAGWAPRALAGAGSGTMDSAAWSAPNGSEGPVVLAAGGGVNYSASEGNPIEVMDLSFATQLAALARLMRERPAPGVHALSAAEELSVARAAIAARGLAIDTDAPAARAGGAAQPWRVHRYRSEAS